MSFKTRSAMTLIEILMVLALLGYLMSVGVPRINRVTRESVRSGVRKLGALVKFCYDQSVLTGKLHRIAFDLGDGMDSMTQSWKLEVAVGDVLPEEQIKEDLSAGSSSESSESSAAENGKAVQPFTAAEESTKHYLPKGIRILEVKSWRLGEDNALRKGPIAVYCFPNGFVDEASVSLQQDDNPKSNVFVVKTRSLTGRVNIDVEEPNAAATQ